MRQSPGTARSCIRRKQCRSQPDFVIRPGTTANAVHFASESKPPPRGGRHRPPCIRSRSASLRKAAPSRILTAVDFRQLHEAPGNAVGETDPAVRYAGAAGRSRRSDLARIRWLGVPSAHRPSAARRQPWPRNPLPRQNAASHCRRLSPQARTEDANRRRTSGQSLPGKPSSAPATCCKPKNRQPSSADSSPGVSGSTGGGAG